MSGTHGREIDVRQRGPLGPAQTVTMSEISSHGVHNERHRFRDRDDAADALIAILGAFAAPQTLVLAIPRGAVPMGVRIARALGARFDLVLVRKLAAPGHPEFALGAVDEEGCVTLSPGLDAMRDAAWLTHELTRQRQVLLERRRLYRRPPPDNAIESATVIVVDDGLATGATMVSALDWVKRRSPALLVAAVPVASSEALDWVGQHADRVLCPWRPPFFGAVSAFYRDFPQVDDQQVLQVLESVQPSPARTVAGREGQAERPNRS
ncbi:MAG: hypothetical protein RL322_1896 [Pseudomonadota bacterium]